MQGFIRLGPGLADAKPIVLRIKVAVSRILFNGNALALIFL